MREKGRHSGESRNPGILKKNKLSKIKRYFSVAGPARMPACAGMTNYDPVSSGRGSFQMKAMLSFILLETFFGADSNHFTIRAEQN